MNRQRYKLVFNRHRGQLMAVAEIASSIQHHGRTSANGAAMPDLLPSALRFSLLAVALALAMNTVAHAQILGDRSAPRNQQPTVLATPNGVPVVNIQTPGAAGVSLNSYRQFDVGPNGAILNNAQGTTATQLGGYVAGNPWLATGAARVIVNQVNSANLSYLRGYLEVAGARAQVVVANPAGITCSGCGFINANRATLTTGVPQIVNGNLDSYRVASGAVRIEGNGMDASRTDYAEIIARAVQVNAGIWAPELKVSAGLNTVSADHASVVPGVAASDAAPAVAIDVAQLGGMYAGHIYLTSTEHGVGVRNSGNIGASVGQAVVTADGRLENSGSLTATGLLAVQTTGGISNAGELGSKSAASLNTTALDNSGSIASAGALTVQASGALQNTGSISGEGNVQIAAASIDNHNSIGSSTTLAVQAAGSLSNSGTLQANADASINAASVDNSGTVRAAQGALNVSSSARTGNSGRMEAAQAVNLQVGSLANSGGVNAGERLRIEAAQSVSNDGTLAANGPVAVQAASLANRGTLASSADAVNVTTSGTLANQGQVNAAQALTLTAAGIDNHSGKLSANDIRIDSQNQSLDNRQGNIAAQRDVRIASGALDNGSGNIVAQGKIDIRSGDLGNDGGLLQAGDALSLDAGSNTVRNANSGSARGIVAQGPLSVTAGALVNRGNVSSNGDISLKTTGLDNDAGVIGANGKLTLEGSAVSNRGGSLQARQGVDVQVGSGSVDNSAGLMRSDGTVNVQAGTVRNDSTQGQNQGIEGATVSVSAADISNRQGAMRGDAITLIRATGDGTNSNITIAGSDINAKGNLALKADNDINLIAAQNTDEQHSDRSSSSWGVGVTAQFGTKTQFGFTANAAGSRGNSDGKDVSNVMTQVRAGGQVNIDSGRDTNLIGATVAGDKVVANVGRDLNIASVQDTSTFKSRDQSIGGSATIGPASGGSVSASRSRVDADYASVGQQAGIMAGDGGFQINVKGNTDLKGAQIASTDKAVEEGKNSLTTGTLTSSDIQNRSQYSAESQSVSAGTSGGKPGGGAGIGNASGSETSVTRSGVSGGAVKITDAQAQQAKTGQSPDQVVASLDTSVRTGKDSSNSLPKELAVVCDHDGDEYVCLDTSSFNNGECPVIVWDAPRRVISRARAASFDTFLETDMLDFIE